MEYITTKQAAAKWGITPTRITILANEGRIPGARLVGRNWLIPADAVKPSERKGGRKSTPREEPVKFSFPLYPYRSDWSSIKETALSGLPAAQSALMECRFADAYALLQPILHAPGDIGTEIGALWSAGICCIGLNMPEEFSAIYLRLQMLLAPDFPHRDDYAVVMDMLKSYVESIGSAAADNVIRTDFDRQCLPVICMKAGYTYFIREVMGSKAADTMLLELNLRFLEMTGASLAAQTMHIYLLGIYNFRQNIAAAEKHAAAAVQLAYENQFYFPLVTFYRYFAQNFDAAVTQYPRLFRERCTQLVAQYERNFTGFFFALGEGSGVFSLTDGDFPYVYAVLSDLSNTLIAQKLNVSTQTVKRKLDKICEKLGVQNKKELRTFLQNQL